MDSSKTNKREFEKLTEEIHDQLADFRKQKLALTASSSFQTQSVPLLHILSLFPEKIDIIFLDTGFLFPETHAFRKQLTRELGLKIRIERSDIPHSQQKDENGLFYYNSDTNYCCHLNKVVPMDRALKDYDVWISGVRADQSSARAGFDPIMETDKGILRYHPLLYWTNKMIYDYLRLYRLPKHPLHDEGYVSIGCMPCTVKWTDQNSRAGRWEGQKKTECGLHTDLAGQKDPSAKPEVV